MAEQKTNVMRLLDQKKVAYRAHAYPHGDDAVDGVTVAGLIGKAPECVFKTLVARGSDKNICVFVIPVCCELDLKRAAKAAKEKSVEMVHVSEINTLTGYIRGGCSPIGMKKALPTWMHQTLTRYDYVFCSAGQRGLQFRLAPQDLLTAAHAILADLVVE